MSERFIKTTGTISVAGGASLVTGTGTTFAGHDLAAAAIIAYPASGAPVFVGLVAEVTPRGVYGNLELPLVKPYRGTTLTNVDYTLVDSVAIASEATPAAIHARFATFLEQKAGLTFNKADTIDFSLVPSNSLFVDAVSRTIFQWRNGVLEPVQVVGGNFNPRGAWAIGTTYAKNDLYTHGGYVFVSNADANVAHAPNTAPASDAWHTYLPLPAPPNGYALSVAIKGRPAAGELIPLHVFADTVTFPAGITGSFGKSRVAFTASSVFALWRNGDQVATVTFGAGQTTGALAAAAQIVFTAGDYADLKCPVARDATGEDIRITFRGTR